MPPHVFLGFWKHFCSFGHFERVATVHVSMWRSQTKGRSICAIAMSKSTKLTMLFQHKHVLEFGLEIIKLEKKGNTSIVTGVRCLFCVYCGQDVELASRKHKPIDNIHIFKASFIK